MHLYDYKIKPLQYLIPEIVAMIVNIHENKERQELFIETNKDELNTIWG